MEVVEADRDDRWMRGKGSFVVVSQEEKISVLCDRETNWQWVVGMGVGVMGRKS